MNLSLFLRKFDWRLFFIFLAISAVGLFSMAGMGPSIKPFLEKERDSFLKWLLELFLSTITPDKVGVHKDVGASLNIYPVRVFGNLIDPVNFKKPVALRQKRSHLGFVCSDGNIIFKNYHNNIHLIKIKIRRVENSACNSR